MSARRTTERVAQPGFSFNFEAVDAAAELGEALIVDLDGFEGPLHLLLSLARAQKVDLARLSIADLADQYLAYVQAARQSRFTLAADYLVMAAWLTYLKSKLLLPRPERRPDDEPAADLAETLAFRLAKLEAMRGAAEALRARPQTGREVFLRGAPEPLAGQATAHREVDLFQLISAYARQRRRTDARSYRAQARIEAFALEDARASLRALLPRLSGWTPLHRLTPRVTGEGGPSPASCTASTFAAGLEMTKEGEVELRQSQAFADLYLRARSEVEVSAEIRPPGVDRAA